MAQVTPEFCVKCRKMFFTNESVEFCKECIKKCKKCKKAISDTYVLCDKCRSNHVIIEPKSDGYVISLWEMTKKYHKWKKYYVDTYNGEFDEYKCMCPRCEFIRK